MSGDRLRSACCVIVTACGGGAEAGERAAWAAGPPATVESPCALVPRARVEAVLGPVGSEPKEKLTRFGPSCRYTFGGSNAPRYVELIWADAATFGGATSDGPDSTRPEGSQDYLVYRRSVAGVGGRAFFANLDGPEYTLWVLEDGRAVAVRAALGPEDLEKYKALAAAQLAVWR